MLYSTILALHIISGFTALLGGGLAFTTRKGSSIHNKAGRFYTVAMVGVGSTAFFMCLLQYNPFLFVIGLFSTYMTLTGYRSLQFYRSVKSLQLKADWSLLLLTFGLSLAFFFHMLWTAGLHLSGMQPVLLIFMGILLSMLLIDAKAYRHMQQQTKSQFLRKHITRMGGAYISTVTAFVVTNIHTSPAILGWLLPTAIGTPFIIYFVKKYTIRKKAKDSVAA